MTSTTNDSIITSRLSVRFSHLTFSTFITTYYLAKTYTELKLSIYALQKNDTDFYHEYQLSQQPDSIWILWMIFIRISIILILFNDMNCFSASVVIRPITTSRILLNTAKCLQTFILMYIEIGYKVNLEKKFNETTPPKDDLRDLIYFQKVFIYFLIIGWFIRLLQYFDRKISLEDIWDFVYGHELSSTQYRSK